MHNLLKEDLDKLSIAKEAIRNSSKESRVYVGCDSKRARGGTQIKYATVIILHHEGKHGCTMWSFIQREQDYTSASKPRLRLINEAYYAVDIASKIIDDIEDRHFELHLDLNTDPKYKSSTAVKEAIGFVLGMLGIKAKVKPNAWASSSAADKLT
jgi:hypothetical protein